MSGVLNLYCARMGRYKSVTAPSSTNSTRYCPSSKSPCLAASTTSPLREIREARHPDAVVPRIDTGMAGGSAQAREPRTTSCVVTRNAGRKGRRAVPANPGARAVPAIRRPRRPKPAALPLAETRRRAHRCVACRPRRKRPTPPARQAARQVPRFAVGDARDEPFRARIA